MRISDWSSDVCSSDLARPRLLGCPHAHRPRSSSGTEKTRNRARRADHLRGVRRCAGARHAPVEEEGPDREDHSLWRSEEHTSELQSLMRISYAVFCLKKKTTIQPTTSTTST